MIFKTGNDEKGSVLVIVLSILVLVTIMGITATIMAQVDLQIAGNDEYRKLAFYAAEASRSFVEASPALYGINNIIVGQEMDFPNNADASEKYALNSKQAFNGSVAYLGATTPPRGTGFQVGKFKAHRYKMSCQGYGPFNILKQIEAGFYRIGF